VGEAELTRLISGLPSCRFCLRKQFISIFSFRITSTYSYRTVYFGGLL